MVCTANVCRSPMMEVLFARRATEHGATGTEVRSGGFLNDEFPASPEAIDVMADRGLDLEAHRSHVVNPDDVAGADLIVCAAREHAREIAALDPSALPKTFTLKELVRRGGETGPRKQGEPVRDWLWRVGDDRNPGSLLGSSANDDIADPIGRGRRAFKKASAEIDGLLSDLAGLLWSQHVAEP